MATITSSTTSSSITIKFSNLSTVPYGREVEITIAGTSKTWSIGANATPTTYTYKKSGLSAGTTYDWSIIVTDTTGTAGNVVFEEYGEETTDEEERPSTFSWTYAKTQDEAFNLTATEWNSFTSKINEMRGYLGLSAYSFTTAVKGADFTASMYNEARIAIQGMGGGAGGYIPTVSKGDSITAYVMNQIVAELNSAINNL